MTKLNVAILGTGKLGTDLLLKVLRSPSLCCTAFTGRNNDSKGIAVARSLGVPTSTQGIEFLQSNPDTFELVFDVTNAFSHLLHWPILNALGKRVVDLTPSQAGHLVVPAINLADACSYSNISLISCGGQASLPLISVLARICQPLKAIEVVSCIASKSAGPGTRINIDEYIANTQAAISYFSGCTDVKSILILNPAVPEIYMKTTIYAEAHCHNPEELIKALAQKVQQVQSYIPGYQLVVGPTIDKNTIVLTIQVKGRGDFLPPYAGNLDIISCAAVQVAEKLAMNHLESSQNAYQYAHT